MGGGWHVENEGRKNEAIESEKFINITQNNVLKMNITIILIYSNYRNTCI